jgi:single-strand DNA-binding protein
MAAQNVNVVVLSGNLTRDPELRHTEGGTTVCELRIAVNGRRKNESGAWVDKPNFFNVVVFGGLAENCGNYLAKGRPVAIEGRLDHQEWDAKDGSGKRQAVKIIANTVQFLGYKKDEAAGSNGSTGTASSDGSAQLSTSEAPPEEPVAAGAGGEDDIPF